MCFKSKTSIKYQQYNLANLLEDSLAIHRALSPLLPCHRHHRPAWQMSLLAQSNVPSGVWKPLKRLRALVSANESDVPPIDLHTSCKEHRRVGLMAPGSTGLLHLAPLAAHVRVSDPSLADLVAQCTLWWPSSPIELMALL